MAGKKESIDEWLSAALMCKEMGWTYEQYINQPTILLDLIRLIRTLEAEEVERNKKYGSNL